MILSKLVSRGQTSSKWSLMYKEWWERGVDELVGYIKMLLLIAPVVDMVVHGLTNHTLCSLSEGCGLRD